MQFKAFHYNAIAQFLKSKEAFAASKYGEEVAWLRFADSMLKKAQELGKHVPEKDMSEVKVV